MTITYVSLVGTFEEIDEVIRYNLENNWSSANTNSKTPDFSSATSINQTYAWIGKSSYKINAVVVNTDTAYPILEERAIGDTLQGMEQLIFIDVWAKDKIGLGLNMREIDRILWEANPNSGTRINKSDTTASHIHRFEPPTITWDIERIANPTTKTVPHASGTLAVRWYKRKS